MTKRELEVLLRKAQAWIRDAEIYCEGVPIADQRNGIKQRDELVLEIEHALQ